MKKNTKHNLCLTGFYTALGLMIGMVGIFIDGIKNNVLPAIIVSSVVFCVCIPVLIIVIKIRPYKNNKKCKVLKNNKLTSNDDQIDKM